MPNFIMDVFTYPCAGIEVNPFYKKAMAIYVRLCLPYQRSLNIVSTNLLPSLKCLVLSFFYSIKCVILDKGPIAQLIM